MTVRFRRIAQIPERVYIRPRVLPVGTLVILERNAMECASPLGDTTSFASIESRINGYDIETQTRARQLAANLVEIITIFNK